MSIIKQISVFDGSNWNTDNIGANAGNIDLMNAEGTAASTIAGSTNLLAGLNNILPASKLTASRALVSNSSGVITTSSVTSTQLGRLSGVSGNIQTQIDTLNTNLNTLKTISEEYLDFTYSSKSTRFYFRVINGVLSIICTKSDSSMTLPTSWTSLGSLSNIKPDSNRYLFFVSANGLTGTFRIYSDGGVTLIAHSSNAYWLQFSATAVYK